jgi:nucleoside-diphosphate-sugar epimerase
MLTQSYFPAQGELMSDTVLVTGGSGFIGSHVCRMLAERGDRVINFDVFRRQPPLVWLMRECENDIIFEKGGVEALGQLIAVVRKYMPNKIVHLAASIDMESLESYPMQVYYSFVGGTINVLEAMRLLGGVERLVNISSIGVLPTVQYQPLDCNHPTLMAAEGTSSGIYGAGKLSGEAFCWAYAELFGLDIVILRPSAAYGFFTSNSIFMNEMLEGALRGESVHLAAGGSLPRDYTHVHDVAGIALAALDARPEQLRHRCFYAASGMNPLVTGSQLAEIIRDMVPTAVVSIAEVTTPLIERYDLKCRGVHDVRPVEEPLGYSIKYRDIRAGMAEYADRYCEYLISQNKTPAKRAW